MTVTRFQIFKREPYADGKSFGAYGPFERIEGRIEYAVDPDHPANAVSSTSRWRHELREAWRSAAM